MNVFSLGAETCDWHSEQTEGLECYDAQNAGDLREAAKRLDAATGTISGTIEPKSANQGRKG